jgi:hypothetical protein
MQFLKLSSSLCVFSLLGLVGCAGFNGASFPDASVNPESASLGSISGSNFGGHAPLVGAHVYVLQPGVTSGSGTSSASAYGALASSILNTNNTANGSNNPNAIANTGDPGIPAGWEYQKTDQTGAFNISGDYSCTVGLPVYLYLYGGDPTYPSGSTNATNTFNIASWSATGTSGAYVVTMTIVTTGTGATNPIENAYIGEGLTVTSTGSANPASAFNTSFQLVTASNLTTTTFSFNYTNPSLPGGASINTTYTQTLEGSTSPANALSNMQVTFDPTFNSGVVNLAMLGNCPSGGFTGANKISYVYVNEVSTTAAAYALAPFGPATITTSNDYADYIGTSSNNVAGIQNAAVIAKQLYDITGSQLSTTYAGEGHIANTATALGNGIVPQANLDTIGNILAACVDSNSGSTTVVAGTPTYGGNTSGTNTNISAQCNTLFTNATSTGIPTSSTGTGANAPGIQPFDTAMAAMNIARHPAGPPNSYLPTASPTTSYNFVNTLYTLPSGNRPFEPDLLSTGAGQPNDFTIAIDYVYGATLNPYSHGAESLAIDKIGNVWVTSQPNGGSNYYFYEFSPTGAPSNVQTQTSYIYGYVTIDSGESAWAGAAFTTAPPVYVLNTNSTTAVAASGSAPPVYSYAAGTTNATNTQYFRYASASDASGNVFFGNETGNQTGLDKVETYYLAATNPTVTGQDTAQLATVNSDVSGFSHAAMATGDKVYFDYNASNFAGTPTVDLVAVTPSSGAGANASTAWPVTNSTSGCASLLDPEAMAVTRSGDVIVSDYHNQTGTLNNATSSVYYITAAGACTQLSGSNLNAGLNSPFGATIDGNDYFYATNRAGSTISVLNTQGGTAASTVAVSPASGYEPQYVVGGTLTNMLNNPLNIAAGPSGELWLTDFTTGAVVEIIGLAAPTTTPLSVATIPASSTAGSIGYKP